jgi:hypothetical protein
MKRSLLLIFVTLLSLVANSQIFYEVQYYDQIDKEKYIGLMTYWDNETCFMRCVPMNGEDVYWECSYSVTFEKEGEINYMIFNPVPEQGKEDIAYPYFIWTWTKKDASDQDESPYISFDLDDEDEKMIQAEYFQEIELSSMDAEYIGQFFDENEEMYSIITSACNIVNDQRPNNNNNNNGGNNTPVNNNNSSVTMHFIMAAATKDATIGESVQTDLNLAQTEFKNFATNLGIGYDEHIISGNSFNRSNILNAINSISAGPNDIIVYLYSGHGFRFDDDTDAFPRMYLAYGEEVNSGNYLGVSDAYDMLLKKKARLTIVLSDCCNSNYGATRQEIDGSALVSRGHNNFDLTKLEKLFINSSGGVKATAAKAGQYALCDAKGGFLLTSFLNNIHSIISAVSSDVPSWQTIIDNASAYVKRKTSGGYDERGQETEPQIVVKSVNVR